MQYRVFVISDQLLQPKKNQNGTFCWVQSLNASVHYTDIWNSSFRKNFSPTSPSRWSWRSVECPWKECWCTGGEPLHVFSACALSVTIESPIFSPLLPRPFSLGMSAFWGTTCCPPRERTQGRRARRDRCINKITLVFHLGKAGCLLLFSSLQMKIQNRSWITLLRDTLPWIYSFSACGLVTVWDVSFISKSHTNIILIAGTILVDCIQL